MLHRDPERPSAGRSLPVLIASLAFCATALWPAQPPPVRPPDKPGFPITLTNAGSVSFTSPIVADLGLSTDGTKSIIFGTDKGELWVIRKASGVWGPAPGFPVKVGTFIASSPAVGDLTGNGVPDIVVGHGDPNTGGPGGVTAVSRTGTILWQVQSLDVIGGAGPDPVVGTPAIGDLDNDGVNEVIWGAFDHHLYVVNGKTGLDKPGWPKNLRDTIWSSPALHDIDGDGRLDIIIGRDAHQEGSPVNTPDGGCLHVFRYDGSWVPGFPYTTPTSPPGLFPKCIDQTIQSAPSVGDIDGDGLPEIVHGTGGFYGPPSHSPSERIYAWNCDGSAVPGWPVTIQGQSKGSPALANLDNDAALEVVVTADNTLSSSTFHVYGFDGNGAPLFASVPKDYFGATLSAGNPVVADVLGPDSKPEILVPSNSSVIIFSENGTQLTDDGTHQAGALSFLADGTVAGTGAVDLENDGAAIEVIAIAGTNASGGADTKISVWNPISRSSQPPWGFFRRDPQRHGVAFATPSCSGPCQLSAPAQDFFTIEPCRVGDTRVAGGALGAPALSSGETRSIPVTGTCGIPSTARAVAVNVTITAPTNTGFLRFAPGGCPTPLSSTINFSAGDTRANNAILPLAKNGSGLLKVNAVVQSAGSVHLILDVTGFFE